MPFIPSTDHSAPNRVGVSAASVYYDRQAPKIKYALNVQSRKDTIAPLPNIPEYIHPDHRPIVRRG